MDKSTNTHSQHDAHAGVPAVPAIAGAPADDLITRVNDDGNHNHNSGGQIQSASGSSSQPSGSRAIPTISYPQRFIAGSGHILNDLCASIWFSYLLLYFENVVQLPPTYSAGLMLLGQITDGLATPLVGYEADRANHCWLCRKGYGRCKSWHLIGVILVLLSFPFIFSPCIHCENSQDWAKVVYYSPFIVIFQIGWASSQISHLALVPKISPDVLIRTEVLAIRYGFTVLSNVTIFVLALLTLGVGSCSITPDTAVIFRNLALYAIGIGGCFSLLFHIFVHEQSDEEVKAAATLMDAQTETENGVEAERKKAFVESFSAVTHVRSVTSSMAISKVHAQAARRRRNSSYGSPGSGGGDREIQSLLADQDDLENSTSIGVTGAGPSHQPSNQSAFPIITSSPNLTTEAHKRCQMDMKSLNLGKDSMTLADWLTLPQFYIVAVMYMATRLSVNVTQVYMPLYLEKSLRLPCGNIATIPLTMYCAGFFVAIFIKLINKYLGRQLSYLFGASLCILGGILIVTLNWEPGTQLATRAIYGVAVALGGGASAILVTSLAITSDLIGNNVENGAFVYGAMSFCDKLSCGLSIMGINIAKTHQSPANEGRFYQYVLGYTAIGCSLAGVLAVFGLTYIIYIQRKRKREEHEA